MARPRAKLADRRGRRCSSWRPDARRCQLLQLFDVAPRGRSPETEIFELLFGAFVALVAIGKLPKPCCN